MSDLEMKSFGPFEIKSEDRGEVVAVVATLGVVDKDGDVIQPGAFPPGGAKVKLSGYSHDVITEGAAPVGKGIVYEEDGRAIFKGQFFMSTQRGREAFLTTKELGAEGEWSFGFPKAVKTAEMTDDWRAKGAKRIIAGLQPIEASPVFVGAGWGTGTLLTKSADGEPGPTVTTDGTTTTITFPTGSAPVESITYQNEPVAEAQADADPVIPAEPVETDEQKAARRVAEAEVKAQRGRIIEALESQQRLARMMGDNPALRRVQQALERLGDAA